MVPSRIKIARVLTVALFRTIWSHLKIAYREWNVLRIKWMRETLAPWQLFHGKAGLPDEHRILGLWKEQFGEIRAIVGYPECGPPPGQDEAFAELNEPFPPRWFEGGWAEWTSYRLGRLYEIDRQHRGRRV